eukprot:8603080-Karenia_brevis.AAC.1
MRLRHLSLWEDMLLPMAVPGGCGVHFLAESGAASATEGRRPITAHAMTGVGAGGKDETPLGEKPP